jgi:hypothetical protein
MYLTALLLITVAFSGCVTFILNQTVIDKETKMKESLKIMSLGRVPYSLSYFFSQGLFVFFVTCVMTLAYLFTYTNPVQQSPRSFHLFFSILLYGFALISIALCLTTLFTDSKLST